MTAPVWALIARVKILGASSGYHRYHLLDQFIQRFDEWWMIGTTHTTQWGFETWDTTNTYVNLGVEGGLITLILFLSIILYSFVNIKIR